MSARLGFRWRQIAHDLGTGLLFRPAAITLAIALFGLTLIELEEVELLPRWSAGGWFFEADPGSA